MRYPCGTRSKTRFSCVTTFAFRRAVAVFLAAIALVIAQLNNSRPLELSLRPRIGRAKKARQRQSRFLHLLSMSSGVSAPSEQLTATPIPYNEWLHHMDAVLDATADLRGLPSGSYAGYAGPWIEEIFANATRRPLHSWYPLVPLFAEWTNVCCSQSLAAISRSNEVHKLFQQHLRNDVIYVAVTQHDMGAPGPWLLNFTLYRNTFIFSGGGWGNVPIPLIAGRTPRIPLEARRDRHIVASFIGKLYHGREQIPDILRNSTLPQEMWRVATGEFNSLSASSIFALCPRGLGRSSYRLTQSIQAGVIPVYVNTNVGDEAGMWVPYKDPLWNNPGTGIGFAVTYETLGKFFCAACSLLIDGSATTLATLSLFETKTNSTTFSCPCTQSRWSELLLDFARVYPSTGVAELERRLHFIADSHFSLNGAIKQIDTFVDSTETWLSAVPKTLTSGTWGGVGL